MPATLPPLEFLRPSLCGSGLGVPEDDDRFSSSRIQASRLEVGAADGGQVLGVRRGTGPATPWGAGTGAVGCHDRRRTSSEDDVMAGADVGVGIDAFLGVGRAVPISGTGSRFATCKSAGGCVGGIEKRFVPSLLPLQPPFPPPVTRRPVVFGPTDRNKLVSRTECRWEDSSGVEEAGGPAGISLLHDMTVRRRDRVDDGSAGVTMASTRVEWRREMRTGCRSGATDTSGIDSRLVVLTLRAAAPVPGAFVDGGGATDQVSGMTCGAGTGTGFRTMVSSVLASWSVLIENRSAIGVVLYRWADSVSRGSDSRSPSLRRSLRPCRRFGEGGDSALVSSNQPSASRSDCTCVMSTSRTGATVGTPSCPVAVGLSFRVDTRRTRPDSFSRTLGSCMLLKLLAFLSQIDVIGTRRK